MSGLELTLSPQEFFHNQVTEACQELQTALDKDLEFYIVNLLCTYIDPPDLETFLSRPLALQLKQALESSHNDQFKLLKNMGDRSLYFAGFFQEYFTSKSIDVNYYISMGSNAYMRISETQPDSSFASIYKGLCRTFSQLVEVISVVADRNHINQDSSILALYEKWLRTKSVRIQKRLEDNGIRPTPVDIKIKQ